MPRVYSTRLAVGMVDGMLTTVYTVPDGQRAVALDMEFLNVGGSYAELLLGVTPAGGSLVQFWHLPSSGINEGGAWRGRLVLNAGDSVVLNSDGQYTYVVSGFLFLV